MVKHIVFWKLKENALGHDKKENALLIKEKLENLNGKIEGLVKLEVGLDFYGNGNYDVALFAELTTPEALDFYQSHPLHQDIAVNFVKQVVEDRKAVDYESK